MRERRYITKAHYGGWCIYTDEGSNYMLIQNNVCYNTNDSLFNQLYGRENLVRNYVFVFGGESVLAHGRADKGQKSIRFEHNILITTINRFFAVDTVVFFLNVITLPT